VKLSTKHLIEGQFVLQRDVSLKIVVPRIGTRAREHIWVLHGLVPLEIMLSAKSTRAKEIPKVMSAFRC
jgi:hypothetical protein